MGHARLSAHADGDGVAVQADGKHIGRRDRWHLAPVGGRCGEFGGEPAAGVAARSDVLGVIVEGCVAGRGFHWQSGHDVTLAGDLELSVVDSALMLVNVLPIEPYLEGVITSEMSGECPRAFMRAHAVVARSWIAAASERKHQSLGIDFCNDDCCQRYQGTAAVTPAARSAVSDTRGQVLIHRGGAVVDANYAKCCGGITESGDEVWGHAKSGQRGSVDAPASDRMHAFARVGDNNIAEYVAASIVNETRAYCSPAVVPAEVAARCLGRVDDGSTHFRWRVGYRADQLVDILQRKGLDRIGRTGSDGIAALRDLRVTRRARGGRAIDLTVEYVDRDDRHRSLAIHDQYWIRHALHESFLYSSAFDVRIERDDHDRVLSVELIGAGWGHGAGMCQVGALGMALQGFDHSAILAHYFDGSSVDAHGGHT
ncbi:MAG: SpoIID/LytB domain-containing protein [Phycisphaerales bacterium]|nr:SpoIID/LytB domain-containing protein [Phycisphaerales bacterium]